ncbi:solute carrier family 2, facilitated glucose transporter member 10-like [Aphis craccivora]|uniref:Solute carrier family 2, facilitated glucose transporter member 10-like n=1 Tax=Aphis craccivora TaxID=307492 RepID=A0A6G0YKY5_APHCR|nr:solute carrier family 2, facilitated glucose transporter member 10-like [Aphis craccivora]
MIFILAYSLGFEPVPWVIMREIFSMKVKPYGISFATAMNWLMVLAGVYFPYEMNESFVPETKKFNLPQIQWEIYATLE